MIEEIKNLTDCGDADVEKQCALILELTESKENGSITEGEYNELLNDIANTMKIDDLAGDMKLKGALVTAINGILKIV